MSAPRRVLWRNAVSDLSCEGCSTASPTMRLASKLSFPHRGLAAGLGSILVVLAALQYSWSGRVSEAERDRMQTILRTAMNQFREDLHHELAGLDSAFELDTAGISSGAEQAYAEYYQEWRRSTPYPDLVADTFLWERREPHSGLLRLSLHTGQFEPQARRHPSGPFIRLVRYELTCDAPRYCAIGSLSPWRLANSSL